MSVRAASFVSLLALAGAIAAGTGCASPAEEEEAPGAADALSSSSAANAVFDLPFYFSVNVDSLTQMTKAERQHPYATYWNPAKDGGSSTGLRVIAVPDTAADRQKMNEKFAATGIMKAGDILLTFRPGLAATVPYAHLQMGATHAGIVRALPGGKVNGVDQPLDSEHNAPNAAPFSSPHYKGAPALHILRPRAMRDPKLQQQLDFWLGKAQALIDKPGRAGFNDNYLAPATSHPKFANDPAKLALTIGGGLLSGNLRGALGIDMNQDNGGEQQLFCSEFAYHLLSLAHCSEAEIASGAQSGEVPDCLQNRPFEQTPFAGISGPGGLGEGPLVVAMKDKATLAPQLPQVFCQPMANGQNPFLCDPESSELSSGHRAANAMLSALKVPEALGLVYQVRSADEAAPVRAQAQPLNNQIPRNYSPTAFLIDTLRDANERQMDYVATVVFMNPSQLEKAKALSKSQPIPRTDGAQ